jgi:hypothetical protein
MRDKEDSGFAIWFARTAVGLVFFINISCAISFILWPERYAPGFEVSGVPGEIIVQSFGILFLMWNATYPPVILRPSRHQTLFAVILVQQLVGVLGEAWLWINLPAGHTALLQTGLRFIVFDGLGLLIMGAAYLLLFARRAAPPQANEIS